MKTPTVSLQNRADALLFGGINEPAGVDEHHIRLIRFRGQFVTMSLGIPKKDFGIDQILGTTKADKTDFAGFV
jgi:hypothetical protein